MPHSKETPHSLRRLSSWARWAWGAHAPGKKNPSPGNQVEIPTVTSVQLCTHSHESGHSQIHSLLPPRVARLILYSEPCLLPLWRWIRNQSLSKYTQLNTTMNWIKLKLTSKEYTCHRKPNHSTHLDSSKFSLV